MIENKIFSCYIIGESNVTIQCAEIILANQQELRGVISPSEKIKKWCNAHSIPYIESIKKFERSHNNEKFDYLFSIVNSQILSKEILNLPRFYAINYHNSPLPKYAGLHATSWAILNNEKHHAISWHIMNELIDAGDVLKQPHFPIDALDTALSLNLKCYEQAILSFRELVEELATNAIKPIKQDLTSRSYYGLKEKAPNLGFISWNQSADCIDKLCRALTFGNYINQLEIPKIIIHGKIFVVKSHKKLSICSEMKPGTIVDISHKGLQIATTTSDIVISELTDLKEKKYDMEYLIGWFNITKNTQLDKIDSEFIKQLSINPAKVPKTEKFWVREFLRCAQEKNSFLSRLDLKKEKKSCQADKKTLIPNKIFEKLQSLTNTKLSLKNILLTAVLIYLYRLNNYRNLSIALVKQKNIGDTLILNKILSNYAPLTTKFECAMSFMEALAFVSNENTRLSTNNFFFTKDIFIRYPELRNSFSVIDVSISFFNSGSTIPNPSNKKLDIRISEDCSWFHFDNNTNYQLHTESYSFLKNMNNHFLTLLEDIASYPGKQLFEICILGKEEKNDLLVAWNNTHGDYDFKKPLHHYFEEQVSKTPYAIAAVFENKSLTYDVLNQKSNKLANYLRYQGVKPNQLVGISLNRSLEMIVCILGILKSGAAYLPLDPNYPEERISYMLSDSKSNLLITDKDSITRKAHPYPGNVVEINSILSLKNISNENPELINNYSDLAYVIYTSGTTGKPKGVAIPHRAVCNHMLWMQKEYAFQDGDVFLQKTPFSFDASVWEFFMPLLGGSKLIIALNDAHASSKQLIRLVREYKVSILQLVPSMLKELVSLPEFDTCQSLKHVFCGGEALLPETINVFFKNNYWGANLHNLYGPTEATIDTTAFTCTAKDAEGDISRIGKPIMNTKVYVLDEKKQPVPVGIIGELYISGDGLARGYLNNHEFTNQKFISNPFSPNKNDRLYRTGDLVKWNSKGVIEYHGRCDNQIKIRGFRIEVNEIEANLEKIPSLLQCIVKPERNADDSLSLSAYILLAENSLLSAVEIRAELKKYVPEYMIPSRFFLVDKFINTPSGKVDRSNLPIPFKQLSSDDNYVPPHNEIEKSLHTIWCSVLKIETIGIYDDFFELGGNSLSAMNIISLIKEKFSLTLSIRKVFDFPTIVTLAQEITNTPYKTNLNISANIIVPLKPVGKKTPLFLVHPIGGSVFWYKLLGKYIDEDRPLYGIQDPGLDKKELIFNNLEEMASAYIDAMQTIQQKGPYLLGGASFGSTVAIEIAKQLQERGEQVTSLISLDGWAFYPTLQNEGSFQKIMEEQNARLLKKYVQNNINHSKFILELQWHREKMLVRYKMPMIKTKFILFKAKELTKMFQYTANFNWWESYSSQPIECHLVPGDHETMFNEPNIKVMVSKLNDSLNANDIPYKSSRVTNANTPAIDHINQEYP